MGFTNLNRQKGMVEILEDEHEKAKSVRFQFVKYSLTTGIANAFLTSFALIIMDAYIHAGIHFFATILIFYFLIRDSIKQLNLKKVGGIVFDNAAFQNYSNIEEVYQATRIVCEMIGFVRGRKSIVNTLHLFSAIMIIAKVCEFFFEYFTMGGN